MKKFTVLSFIRSNKILLNILVDFRKAISKKKMLFTNFIDHDSMFPGLIKETIIVECEQFNALKVSVKSNI